MPDKVYLTSTEFATRCGVPYHKIMRAIMDGKLVPDGQVSRGVGFCPVFDEDKVDSICQELFGRPPVFVRRENPITRIA